MVRPQGIELPAARSSISPQQVEKRCVLMRIGEDNMSRSEPKRRGAPGQRSCSSRRRSTGWCITGHRLRVSGARRCRDGYFGLEAVAATTAGPSGSVQRRDSARSNDHAASRPRRRSTGEREWRFDRPILENRAHGPIGSDDQTSSVQRLRRVGARCRRRRLRRRRWDEQGAERSPGRTRLFVVGRHLGLHRVLDRY